MDPQFERIQLADGRHLDVRTSGPSDGTILVFHHGTPGSALPTRVIERAAHGRGLRLMTTSRPGYGASTPQPGRRVVERRGRHPGRPRPPGGGALPGGRVVRWWAPRLGLRGTAGRGRGRTHHRRRGPYGAEGLDWLAGMGQDNVDEFGAALEGKAPLRAYLDAAREQLRDLTVERMISSMASLLPEVDRAVLTDEFGEDMVAGFEEGPRIGIEGWLEDDMAFSGPRGFTLDEIGVPTMIWQGSEDLMVPNEHGRWLAGHVPNASVHLEAGQGHLSIGIGALDRMLDGLVGVAGP